MARRRQKNVALTRKLQILRTLTNSKSVNRSSIIVDTLIYICKLKLRLEAVRRENSYLMPLKRDCLSQLQLCTMIQPKVQVEKDIEEGLYQVKVSCDNRGGDKLVSILEAFDKMCLNVMEARVSCNNLLCFDMEATVLAAKDKPELLEKDVTRALLGAIKDTYVQDRSDTHFSSSGSERHDGDNTELRKQ